MGKSKIKKIKIPIKLIGDTDYPKKFNLSKLDAQIKMIFYSIL